MDVPALGHVHLPCCIHLLVPLLYLRLFTVAGGGYSFCDMCLQLAYALTVPCAHSRQLVSDRVRSHSCTVALCARTRFVAMSPFRPCGGVPKSACAVAGCSWSSVAGR